MKYERFHRFKKSRSNPTRIQILGSQSVKTIQLFDLESINRLFFQVRQNGSDMNTGHNPHSRPGLQLSESSSGGERVDDDGDEQESDSSS